MNCLPNILVIFCVNFLIISTTNTSVNGQLSTRIITVPADSTQRVLIYDDDESRPAPDVAFIAVGLHSQKHNLTLSKGNTNVTNSTIGAASVTGRDIGLVFMTASTPVATVLIRNNNSADVNALLTIDGHKDNDPIPGACNEEFPLEISPFLRLYDNSNVNRLEFQLANIGSPKGYIPMPCDKSQFLINYDIYSYYLNENDFSEEEYIRALTVMSNVSSIEAHGTRLINTSTTRSYFYSYRGRGVVYNIIASSQHYSSAYVPILTYDCEDLNNCYKQSLTAQIVFALLGLFGLIVCLKGHHWFQTQLLFFGYIDGSFITYILLLKYTELNDGQVAIYTIGVGAIMAVLWLTVWKVLAIPVLSLIYTGFTLGFLFVATILFTAVGNLQLFHNDMNYWLIMCCTIILVPLFFLMVNAVFLSIISSSIVGAYISVMACDRYIDGSLSYIVINVVKRALHNYQAVNTVPFQNKDIVLSFLWLLLSLTGIVLQNMNNTPEKSPFPAPNGCAHPHRHVHRRCRHRRHDYWNDVVDGQHRRRYRRHADRHAINRRFEPSPPVYADRLYSSVRDERTALLYTCHNSGAHNRLGGNRTDSPPPDYDYIVTNVNHRDYQSI